MVTTGVRAGAAVAILVLAVGCSDDQASPPEAAPQTITPSETGAPAISAERYYEAMRVGDFASFNDAQLDEIGKGFCADLDGMAEDERKFAVVAIKESAGLTEAEAFRVTLAMAGRWCPEHASHYVLE